MNGKEKREESSLLISIRNAALRKAIFRSDYESYDMEGRNHGEFLCKHRRG